MPEEPGSVWRGGMGCKDCKLCLLIQLYSTSHMFWIFEVLLKSKY